MILVSVFFINEVHALSPEDCGSNQVWQNNECIDNTSPPKNDLNLHTDKVLYGQGDTVVITGMIPNIENFPSTSDVAIIVRMPDNNILTIIQAHPNADGSFQTSLKADGPQFIMAGDYTVLANFAGLKSQITFEFTGGNGAIVSGGDSQSQICPSGQTLINGKCDAPIPISATNTFEIDTGIPNSIFTFKIIYSDSPRYAELTDYNNALNWKQLKPIIQNSDDPLALLSTISNQLSEKSNEASTTLNQITRYNSDGTETKEYIHGWIENYIFYRFNQDYVNAIIELVNYGMSIETAINKIDERVEGYIPKETPIIPESKITVSTDKLEYYEGDTITISGKVTNIIPEKLVVVQIFNEKNLTWIAQEKVAQDGMFTVRVNSALFNENKRYTVTASYGSSNSSTEFFFNVETIPPTTDDLPYEITITPASGSGSPSCENTVDGCFIPRKASVAVGGKVIFSNTDTSAHTFTSGTATEGASGVFDSGLVVAGSSYEWTPTTEGEVPYFCMVHPWMTGTIFVGEGTYNPPTEDNFNLQVTMGNSVYDLLDTATMDLSIDGITTPQNVALEISDPRGTTVISRSFMVDSQGTSFEFRIDENFKTGTYKVVATTSDNGNTITDTAYFKVKSQYNSFKITSVQVTDQQGNPSNLQAGEMGFIKVNLEASKSITTLVTVNLFDSDLTSIGIGSIKTTLSSGNSEIILSFMIPSDVAVGQSDVYVNAFSDWPSNGGIPLTGEISVAEDIQ